MSILCSLYSVDILKCWLIAVLDTRYIILFRYNNFLYNRTHYSWWYDSLYFIISNGFALYCWWSQCGFGCILLTWCSLIVASIIIVSICTHHSWCRAVIYCSAALIDFLGGGRSNSCLFDPILLAISSHDFIVHDASRHICICLQLQLTATA